MILFLGFACAVLVVTYYRGLIQLLAYLALCYLLFAQLLTQMEEPEKQTLKHALGVLTRVISRTAALAANQAQEHWENFTWDAAAAATATTSED